MTPISSDVVRELARFRSLNAPVISCYLDVDGSRYPRARDYEQELEVLLREAVERGRAALADDDVDRIRSHVANGVDRSQVRGLAMFACGEHDLWQTVSLPVPVRNQLVVNDAPAVGQLERVLQVADPVGVLLVDRQRARVLVFELGQLVAHRELVEDLPRDYDVRGDRERGDTANHVEALARQHLRRAAELAFDVHTDVGLEHLLLGIPEGLAAEVEELLHPYLRERVRGRVRLEVASSIAEVREVVLEAEAELAQRGEQEVVDRLRDAIGRDHLGVSGLPDVLDALALRRVEHLLVSEGFGQAGWRCDSCDRLASVGRSCPACGAEMGAVDDVVEEAVEGALAQGCRVTLCADNADLDVVGRVGALLRF